MTVVANPRCFAAGLQLRHCPLGPRRGAELVECLQSRAQLLSRIDSPSTSAQPLPVIELCSRALEYIGGGVVMTVCLFVFFDVRLVRRHQRPCPGSGCEGEREALDPGGRLVLGGNLARLVDAAEADQSVDNVWSRRQIRV